MKNERLDNRNILKMHYFPEIPIVPSSGKGRGVGQGSTFQPVGFAKDVGSYENLLDQSSRSRKLAGDPDNKASEPQRQAYVQGYTEGKKIGIETEKTKLESALNTLHQIAMELKEIRTELYRNAEKETVNLALAIAAKIVRYEVAINKNVVVSIVKEALKKLVDYDRVIIRVNPSDYQFLKTQKHQFSDLVDNKEKMTFEEDETILSGGCLIETSLGDIDARIEKQLETVEEALRSEFQRTGSQQS